ncbi:MAG: hypothetical protein JOY92_05760 [Verrucomicrobia bacterium]|nr:hypothetical protein [Verrucomicrobiota bacterium]
MPERSIYNGSPNLEFPSFRERSIEFALDRVIHDFSNAIGGIVTLTDHHLQYDHEYLDPRLSASLRLIHDSAEQCRVLLSAVRGAFDPAMNDRVYMRAGDLAGEVGQLFQALLPRSIRFLPTPLCPQPAVHVRPAEFKARWLAVASLDCQHAKAAVQVEFGCTVEDGLCWFWYRSSNVDRLNLAEIGRILLPLAGVDERTSCCITAEGLVAGAALPVELDL